MIPRSHRRGPGPATRTAAVVYLALAVILMLTGCVGDDHAPGFTETGAGACDPEDAKVTWGEPIVGLPRLAGVTVSKHTNDGSSASSTLEFPPGPEFVGTVLAALAGFDTIAERHWEDLLILDARREGGLPARFAERPPVGEGASIDLSTDAEVVRTTVSAEVVGTLAVPFSIDCGVPEAAVGTLVAVDGQLPEMLVFDCALDPVEADLVSVEVHHYCE